MVIAGSYADHRSSQAEAIRPTDAARGEKPTFMYSYPSFESAGAQDTVLIALAPRVDGVAPPPGVDAWPRPGHVVLSPALAADLGANEDHFGPVDGIIRDQGLETPTERRVYLRPRSEAMEALDLRPATGYGRRTDPIGYGLPTLNAPSNATVASVLFATLVAPGLVCVALATSLDGPSSERRIRLLTVLGASWRHRSIVAASEAAPALIAGTALAAPIGVGLMLTDLTMPWLDVVIPASVSRASVWALTASSAASLAVALMLVVLTREARRHRGQRRSAARTALPVARAGWFVVVVLGTIWVTASSQSAQVRSLALMLGTLLAAVCLPAVIALYLHLLGGLIAGPALRAGKVGLGLGGRRLQQFPARTARLTLGVSFAVLALGQVQLWSSQLGEQYTSAVAAQQHAGDTFATSTRTSYTPQVTDFIDALPQSAAPAWLAYPSDRLEITAPCATLDLLELPCEDATLAPQGPNVQLAAMMQTGFGDPQVTVRVSEEPDLDKLEEQGATLAVVSPHVDGLPLVDIQRLSYVHVPTGLQIDTTERTWVTAGTLSLGRSHAIAIFGAIGMTVVALVGACSLAGDVIGSAGELKALTLLTRRRGWIYLLGFVRVGLPLLLASATAVATYLMLPLGMNAGVTVMQTSPLFAVWALAVSAVVATIMGLWSARAHLTAARRAPSPAPAATAKMDG